MAANPAWLHVGKAGGEGGAEGGGGGQQQQRGGLGDPQQLLGIHGDRIRQIEACNTVAMGIGKGEDRSDRPIHMEPHPMLMTKGGDGG